LLFLIALFVAPLAGAQCPSRHNPRPLSSWSGSLMMTRPTSNGPIRKSLSPFLTMLAIPMTFSIANGLPSFLLLDGR